MQMEFMEKYPNGLKRTIALFEMAAKDVMTSEEMDRVIRSAEMEDNAEEKEHLEALKEGAKEIAQWPWYEWHWIELLMQIESKHLFRDIICHMVMLDNKVITQEDEIGGNGCG